MIELPTTTTLLTENRDGVLHVTLNRPERKNALSAQMVEELFSVFSALADERELRAIVLRGQGGTFCAGADVKDMPTVRSDQPVPSDPRAASARANRRFGDVLCAVSAVAAPVVAVAEGSVMGGGFGLVCVSDVALARADARFGLPETGLGLI